MSTHHIHIHLSRDAFNEADHPRANNGQFGAGAGKSHKEHEVHHLGRAAEHKKKINPALGKSNRHDPHEHAYNLHVGAARYHNEAARGHMDPEEAHERSRQAHKASEEARAK